MQNPMQFPFGYGLHLENYSASSGHYPQVPHEAVPSQMNNQYVADYHSACYSVPVQSVITPSVGPSMLNTQQPQQLYSGAAHPVESAGGLTQGAISSASHLHTGVPQSYSALSSHYSSSTSSSVASQGFPLSSGHYAMPTVSSAVYPNLSYPSMSIGSPYGQVFTSQSLPAVGQFEETNAFPGQSSTVPRTLPHQVPVGYNSTSWSTSDFQSAQDNFSRNRTGSLAKASNQINTGIILCQNQEVS